MHGRRQGEPKTRRPGVHARPVGRFARLRWRLTLSHLAATAVTLVLMIAFAVVVATTIITVREKPERALERDTASVAFAVRGLAARGPSPELDAVLRSLGDGSLQLGRTSWSGDAQTGPVWWGATSLPNVVAIALIARDGTTIATTSTTTPTGGDAWRQATAAALAGRSVTLRAGGNGVAAVGAAPVRDTGGTPVAAAVLAVDQLPSGAGTPRLLLAFAIFGAATFGVLSAASLFALASASVVAYLLARRMVARLEGLGAAAGALAAGDLTVRAEEGPADEIGLLARRFNDMAADLERTLRAVQAERDRVAGVLENRRQLVAGVSHELRTPVATVRGYLESALGRDEDLPPGVRADLETMEREIARLQRLMEDLFTLSRADVGRLDLRPEPVDAGALVQRLVETSAPLAWRGRRVQLIAEVAPDLPRARADGGRLEQVVSNLLSNAVRHTPPGGLVAVAVAAEPEVLRIDVRDTGDGIAPDDLPHIFERFYRGREGEGEARGGAGLGLALTRELTEAMGGTVSVESTEGEGSCFSVRLPCA